MAKNNKKSPIKKNRFRLEFSLGEALGWAALLVFICGWFFILGIFVGRGLVPVPDQDEAVKKYLAEADKTAAAATMTPVEKKPAAPTAKNSQARPDREQPKPAAPLPIAADAPEKAPLIEKHVPEDMEEAPADMGGKIFTIQVAALQEPEAADQLFKKLKKDNYAPYIVKANLSDGVTWYRLRCGRFADHNEAAPVLEELRKGGYSPILVRR